MECIQVYKTLIFGIHVFLSESLVFFFFSLNKTLKLIKEETKNLISQLVESKKTLDHDKKQEVEICYIPLLNQMKFPNFWSI